METFSLGSRLPYSASLFNQSSRLSIHLLYYPLPFSCRYTVCARQCAHLYINGYGNNPVDPIHLFADAPNCPYTCHTSYPTIPSHPNHTYCTPYSTNIQVHVLELPIITKGYASSRITGAEHKVLSYTYPNTTSSQRNNNSREKSYNEH